jgi:hypothetical protein
VRAGQFRIFSISTVDEALEILTAVPAGEKGPDGLYPPDSINGRVQAKLIRFAKQLQAFTAERIEWAPSIAREPDA